ALCMLVMPGAGLGSSFILRLIFRALLWVVGAPLRLYAGILVLMVFVLLLLTVVAKYRLGRLTSFFDPQGGPTGRDMQRIQGQWAVGSGGWFGVGLGASRLKWGGGPADTTDLVFPILGHGL